MFVAVFSDKAKPGGGYSGSFIFTPKSVRVIAREALHATVGIQVIESPALPDKNFGWQAMVFKVR